jgi:hypothetical protein
MHAMKHGVGKGMDTVQLAQLFGCSHTRMHMDLTQLK